MGLGRLDLERQLVQNDESKKKKILELYKKKYDVIVKNKNLSINKLEDVLSKKVTKKVQTKAVLRIQAFFRMFMVKKRYTEFVRKRIEAASYIQRVWKRYRMISMVPKAWRKFKNERMTRIQKYMRGYIIHKRIFEKVSKIKLKTNFEYFGNLKQKLDEDAQIKIRYYWLRFKRMAKKKIELSKKSKSKKKLKNQPKLNSFRKGSIIYKNPSVPTPAINLSSTLKAPSEGRRSQFSSPKNKAVSSIMADEEPLIKVNPTEISRSQREIESIKEE